ncbi:hypothetical protein [Streptomyces sp. NPDC087300]|uniref:hypothetical protein n=1 Tax=Streptomyces sp. NPDC087300 TaxID=3365780 RepID=UPI0038211CB8
MSAEQRLLEAGAVLPPLRDRARTDAEAASGDTGNAPAEGDTLTARAYGHPVLEGRTVVRLVPEAIGPAEDLALEYLGFGGGTSTTVGRVRRRSLGFPAWALVNDPANGRHALAVVKEMERLARLVTSKPGQAKEGFDEIGDRLDRSVPHFLPTYYEQVARLFLAAESRQHASVFFGKARSAEQRHALDIDEARLREVFLEFAGAGALSGKVLREHAKGLAARLSGQEAYEQFRTLSSQRCAAGIAPYAGMLEDLRRLARGAGLTARAEEISLLAEIIHSGAMTRAAGSFWKSALPALAELAAAEPAVRRRLLTLMPTAGGDATEAFDEAWLALLDTCGAVGLLLDGSVGAAEWLGSWARHRQRGWRQSARLSAELALVERLAPRLIADGTPVPLVTDEGWRSEVDLDLLDAVLAAGVPVADPPASAENLELRNWLEDDGEGRRDLVAVTSDARFVPLLHKAVESLSLADGPAAVPSARLARLAEHPALRTVLASWLADRAADLARPVGLPGLDELLRGVARFSKPSVLATAPEAVGRIVSFDLAPVLARTLRAGILDELGWPALDEAVEALGDPAKAAAHPPQWSSSYGDGYKCADAWPALVVRAGTRAVLAGPDGVLEQRTLTLPAKTSQHGEPTVRFVDGQWLVASGYGNERRATWSGNPADVFKPAGLQDGWYHAGTVSLPLPGGGRSYGARPVHPGDTSFAEQRREIASDGVSYWVLHEDRWHEYDPASARRGRASVPAFFDSALAGTGAGAADGTSDVPGRGTRLAEKACRLLPVQAGLEGSPFGSKDGLLGWWVTYDERAGTHTACSVDGSQGPATGDGLPAAPLRLPAGAVLHPVRQGWNNAVVELRDADGVPVARVLTGDRGSAYSAGTRFVPPLWYWHALRPRDERGSAALRAVTDADAAALLAAVKGGERPEAAVARLLPALTHPSLARGVAGLVEETARCAKRIATLAEHADRQGAREQDTARVRHAFDGVLRAATQGLTGSRHFSTTFHYGRDEQAATAVEQLAAFGRVVGAGTPAGKLGLSGTAVAWLTLTGPGMTALAVRAAAPTTDDAHRAALLELLDAVLAVRADDDSVLVDPRGRLRVVELKTSRSARPERVGEVLVSGERRMLIVSCQRVDGDDAYWNGIEYDPAGAFGAWDGFALTSAEVHGTPDAPRRAPALRRLVALVRERGPLPYRPEQAQEFAERAGVSPVAGALLQLGLPGLRGYGRDTLLPAEYLKPLGAKSAEARAARSVLEDIEAGQLQAFTAALVPSDPERVADLWSTGFDLDDAAGLWVDVRGRHRVAPPELVGLVVGELGPGPVLDHVLNPGTRPELTGRTEQKLDDGLKPVDADALLTGSALVSYVATLRWLAYRLPYGDPLRAVLPETLRMLRERLADPGLLLDLRVSWGTDGKATGERVREAFGLAARGGADDREFVTAGPAIVLTPMSYRHEWDAVWVRPSALLPSAGEDAGPDHPALRLLAGLARESEPLTALRTLLGAEFTALLTADGPPGAPQHPLIGAPEAVAAVRERHGLSEDAAVLYLMVLALPDPTDRRQAAWTGWKSARLKKARAELAATDLVVEAKRARAGRSLFLPGGWLDLKAPYLPMESWKTPLLPLTGSRAVVPHHTVPELYARTWQRVVDGDEPGYEEFKERSGRGGRGGGRR